MNKTILILFYLLLPATARLQETKKISSLDPFFAGVPLQKDYQAWVEFVTVNYSIDSFKKAWLYSSFKADTKDRFPFPDHIPVRIYLSSGIKNVASAKLIDTMRSISVSGTFGTGKTAKKEAESFLQQLDDLLKPYYKKRSRSGTSIYFHEGINEQFPEIRAGMFTGHNKNEPWKVSLHCQIDHWVKY